MVGMGNDDASVILCSTECYNGHGREVGMFLYRIWINSLAISRILCIFAV